MDAFSSPASTLVSGAATTTLPPTTHREQLFLRASSPHRHLSHKPKSSASPLYHSTHPHLLPLSAGSAVPPRTTTSPLRLSPPNAATTYTRASTGYAAALLDVARCTGAFDAVEADSRRLLPEVRRVPEGPRAGEAVMDAVVEGGAHRHLAVLTRMLVGKGRSGMVAEVMEELGRLCDELRGTKVVVVTSEERMQTEELAGIAEKVRRRSGASSVKVRHVRRASCESSSLPA